MEGIRKIYLSKSKTFLAFCFCFLVGSGVASLSSGIFSVQYWFIILSVLTALTILIWDKRTIRFFSLCALIILSGFLRLAISVPNCANSSVLCSLNGRQANLTGIISDEPNNKVDGITYTVSVGTGRDLSAFAGKFLMKAKSYPVFYYGDEVSVRCKLQSPSNKDGGTFRYDKYLARYGIWSTCSFPQIKKISGGNGNKIMEYILSFKSYLNARLAELWVEPEGSFMAGILYGAKSGLPQYLTDDFSRTGVSHIIAVSGFNITILVVVFMSAFFAVGLDRKQAFYAIVIFTFLFIALTGFSASAVRAGIMAVVVLGAKQVGRPARILNVLVFTAAVMQLMNPYLLLWDVGFQLSFLALMGLVYISPVLIKISEGRILRFTQDDRLKFVMEPLVATSSAIIMTMPVILYQFGTLSLVAPLVNILILWIVPYLMLAGAVTIVAGAVFLPLGKLLAYATHFGLYYVIMVVQFFGEKSWASVNVPIPLWGMIGIYGVIWFVIARSLKTTKQSHQ